MSEKPSFFSELKRRNVYKVAVAYAVVGWLLVQVATQVFPFFEITELGRAPHSPFDSRRLSNRARDRSGLSNRHRKESNERQSPTRRVSAHAVKLGSTW